MNAFRFLPLALVVGLVLTPARPAGAQISRTNSSSTRSTSTSRSTSSGSQAGVGGGGSAYSSGGIRQYRSNTLLGDAIVQVDPETRSVIVVTDEETHQQIAKVIEELDHPKPQVLIKVVFVEVSLNKDLDIGLEGSYTFKVGSGAPILSGTTNSTTTVNSNNGSGGTVNTVTTTTAPSFTNSNGVATVSSLFGLASAAAASGGMGTLATVTASNWEATLHALASKGNLRVLSRPTIMARNNQEAVIVVGQEVPFITNSQTTENGAINNTVQYQDVGIILRVTPFITADKSVEMIVNPEISSLSDKTVAISSTVNAAVINKRSAETVVVTPNATTVVIGGMMQKQKTSAIKKVPILGDIPVLGLPFRHTVLSEEKTELMIFLTPYIVDSPNKLKDITLREANKAELTRDAFPPDEMNKNLEPLLLTPMEEALPEAKTIKKPATR